MFASLVAAGCGDDDGDPNTSLDGDSAVSATDAGTDAGACVADESAPVPPDRCGADPNNPALPSCSAWLKVEPPGATCSNGSPYKFFVNYAPGSNNLVIMFEGGGACWDYASCSGAARGAANANGIADDHVTAKQYDYLNLLRRDDTNPVRNWNMVFVPYCTGDVHTGDKVATYEAPDGGPPLNYRHVGHRNTLAVIDWIKGRFTNIPKLLVTGCSAGGIGALQNYAFIRTGLSGVQCSYLLNDSGPAFHSGGNSDQLFDLVGPAWNRDALLASAASALAISTEELRRDPGLINTVLADKFPRDRLAISVYRMDFNYSLYSYERFFPGSSEARIHELWWQDLSRMLASYDTRPNLSYYVPYFRNDNCSHCVSIPPVGRDVQTILMTPWLGSEIQASQIDLRGFTELLLDDARPLARYLEEPQPNEQFTAEELAMCLTP